MPQPILAVSNISATPQDINLISNTSISDPLSSQFSLPNPIQSLRNPINPPQGSISNNERLLTPAHSNHSFNTVNSSPSFQSSLKLSFQDTTPINTISSNSPTPDPYQHSHNCIEKHPDTTRTYPTLPLKLDSNFDVSPPALFADHNNGEKLHNSAKQRISKSYKNNTVDKQREHDLLKQSKTAFSVEIVVGKDKSIFHPQAAAPPIFRVKTNPSHFICQ